MWCSYGLVVIRLLHLISIATICAGFETCFWHFRGRVNEGSIEATQEDENDLYTLRALLYTFMALSLFFCYLQNLYVIKEEDTNRNIIKVMRWKLFYCLRGQYYINHDGSWRGELNPIGPCDGFITFALFIFTLCTIAISVGGINKMELIFISQGFSCPKCYDVRN